MDSIGIETEVSLRDRVPVRFVYIWSCLLAVALGTGACDKNSTSAAVPSSPLQLYLDHAQPKLPTVKLWLGPKEMVAEVARKDTEVATGMMFRTNMAPEDG